MTGAAMFDETFSLAGLTALVLGAAGGVGEATARLFADAGAFVFAADIDGARAKAIAADIGAARAFGLAVDVTDAASVAAVFDAIAAAGRRPDVVVNTVGLFPKYEFMDLNVEQWDAMQAVNLRGAFLVMQAAVRAMRADGKGGSVVNISSMAGARVGVLNDQAYSASKAGMNSLTQTCALQYAPDNIRVNAILPGPITTEAARSLKTGFTMTGPMMQPGRLPLGRKSSGLTIAQAALFLAGPAAANITGVLLPVDGGFHLS